MCQFLSWRQRIRNHLSIYVNILILRNRETMSSETNQGCSLFSYSLWATNGFYMFYKTNKQKHTWKQKEYVMETVWPATPKIFTIWPFKREFGRPCLYLKVFIYINKVIFFCKSLISSFYIFALGLPPITPFLSLSSFFWGQLHHYILLQCKLRELWNDICHGPQRGAFCCLCM